MKYLLALLAVFTPAGGATAEDNSKTSISPKRFTHPGLLHNLEELEFVTEKIATDQQPWTSAWGQLKSSEVASLDYQPDARTRVERGAGNRLQIGSSEMSRDAAAAYAMHCSGALPVATYMRSKRSRS